MTTAINVAEPAGVGPRRPGPSVMRNPWIGFAVRRVTRLLISLWVLVTAAFFMVQLIPGDPVRAALGKYATTELVEAQRELLGLNDPLPVQYWHYVQGLFTGDLGSSIPLSLPVSDIIAQRFPATAQIALLAFGVIVLTALPLGILTAAGTRGGRRGRLQLGFTSTTIFLAAIPDFLFAVGLVYVFGVSLEWLPIAGRSDLSSYVLPVLALTIGPAAILARIVRVETLSVLGEDFIRTARSKRLPARVIYLRHALPNALTATLTFGGLLLTGLLAGTVLVENVFAWPGLGSVIVSSIQSQDYAVVQAIVLIYGLMILAVNLVVDVALALLDPRSTLKEA